MLKRSPWPFYAVFALFALIGMTNKASATIIADFSRIGPNTPFAVVSFDQSTNASSISGSAISINVGVNSAIPSGPAYLFFNSVTSSAAPLSEDPSDPTDLTLQTGYSGSFDIRSTADSSPGAANLLLTARFTNGWMRLGGAGAGFTVAARFISPSNPNNQTLIVTSPYLSGGANGPSLSISFSSGRYADFTRSFTNQYDVTGSILSGVPLPPESVAPEPATALTATLGSIAGLFFARRRVGKNS